MDEGRVPLFFREGQLFEDVAGTPLPGIAAPAVQPGVDIIGAVGAGERTATGSRDKVAAAEERVAGIEKVLIREFKRVQVQRRGYLPLYYFPVLLRPDIRDMDGRFRGQRQGQGRQGAVPLAYADIIHAVLRYDFFRDAGGMYAAESHGDAQLFFSGFGPAQRPAVIVGED